MGEGVLSRRGWLVPAAIYAASLVVFLAWSRANLVEFPLDDAWIHRVYARAFAHGGGFAYNTGVQEAGCTSPLWVVLTAPLQWLEPLVGTTGVVIAVKLFGAALGALSVAAVYRLAPARAWLAASLFACEPVLMFDALSGMEVVLCVALWLWLCESIAAQRWRIAMVLLGLLPIARPEGVLLAAAAMLVLRRRMIAPWAIAWCIVPTVAWIAFCEIATGHLLPNTYYLKLAGSLDGLAKLPGALAPHGWVILVVGATGLAVTRRLGLLALGSLGFAVAIVTTRSYQLDGYYWTRWTDPGALGLAAACAIGLPLAIEQLLARVSRRVAIAAIAAVAIAAAPWWIAGIAERAERLGSDGRVIARMNVAPGKWIAAHVPETAVIGVNDAGALRYFGERETIDLIGLNSADIAFARVPFAQIARRIDWLAAYPVVFQLDAAFSRFAQRRWFTVPPGEYTICDCAGQTEMVVAERGGRASFDRDAMLAVLRDKPSAIAIAAAPAASARAEQLRAIFVEAGWRAAPVTPAQLPPGLALFAGAERPPSLEVVREALGAAGLRARVTMGVELDHTAPPFGGAADPGRAGLVEQPFVLAVGSP